MSALKHCVYVMRVMGAYPLDKKACNEIGMEAASELAALEKRIGELLGDMKKIEFFLDPNKGVGEPQIIAARSVALMAIKDIEKQLKGTK